MDIEVLQRAEPISENSMKSIHKQLEKIIDTLLRFSIEFGTALKKLA